MIVFGYSFDCYFDVFSTVEAEKSNRDCRSARELYEKIQRLHTENMRSIQSSIKELTEKLETVTRSKELESVKKSEALEQISALREMNEKLRVQVHHMFVEGRRLCQL